MVASRLEEQRRGPPGTEVVMLGRPRCGPIWQGWGRAGGSLQPPRERRRQETSVRDSRQQEALEIVQALSPAPTLSQAR